MRRTWQLQEAKNRLSEVVDLAIEEGPQTVTRHGRAAVVIVATTEFERLKQRRAPHGTILPFLRKLRFAGAGLTFARSKDLDRDVEL